MEEEGKGDVSVLLKSEDDPLTRCDAAACMTPANSASRTSLKIGRGTRYYHLDYFQNQVLSTGSSTITTGFILNFKSREPETFASDEVSSLVVR